MQSICACAYALLQELEEYIKRLIKVVDMCKAIQLLVDVHLSLYVMLTSICTVQYTSYCLLGLGFFNPKYFPTTTYLLVGNLAALVKCLRLYFDSCNSAERNSAQRSTKLIP